MSSNPTPAEREVLAHTARTGRYVTDPNATMDALVARGWLLDYGAQALAGGMHYYVLTTEGRKVLRA